MKKPGQLLIFMSSSPLLAVLSQTRLDQSIASGLGSAPMAKAPARPRCGEHISEANPSSAPAASISAESPVNRAIIQVVVSVCIGTISMA